MKIGVLGAPGSGKAEFANDLAAIMGKDFFVLHATHTDGIGYVDDLRSGTGMEYGGFGNHVDDMQIVFKRREWELSWLNREKSTITVGTVLDSASHCFVRSEETAHTRYEIGLHAERLRTVAATFGLLYTDTWDYDYAFLLGYMGDDPHSKLINASLIALLGSYRAPVLTFQKAIPDDEKAQTAANAIATLEAEQPPQAQERGVRRGGEAGGDDRDSAESVSDVSE